MALPTAALNVYGITIFETGSRTLSQFREDWQVEIIQYAAGKYAVVIIDTTLAAGRITQIQYDSILRLMPAVTGGEGGEDTTESKD